MSRYYLNVKYGSFDVCDIHGATEETRNLILSKYAGDPKYTIASCIEEIPIKNDELLELDFSIRVYNCLKRGNINTLSQLIVSYNDNSLCHLRNLGQRLYKEIEDKLCALNLVRRHEDE